MSSSVFSVMTTAKSLHLNRHCKKSHQAFLFSSTYLPWLSIYCRAFGSSSKRAAPHSFTGRSKCQTQSGQLFIIITEKYFTWLSETLTHQMFRTSRRYVAQLTLYGEWSEERGSHCSKVSSRMMMSQTSWLTAHSYQVIYLLHTTRESCQTCFLVMTCYI